jgi:exodeoxyribonuclease-3
MKTLRILSWNVNGLRAICKKGFVDWLQKTQPDILCIQESRLSMDQIPNDVKNIENYHIYIRTAERKGYSGVMLFCKQDPSEVEYGIGVEKFDIEGRVIIAEYDPFTLLNVYFPNGRSSPERLDYKMDFYNTFLKFVDKLKAKGKHLVICGDLNTAHKEIDLAHPKENEHHSGFLPIEREWIDKFLKHGYIDTFRTFNKDPDNYSWWDYKTRARERNVGWRLDYFFISKSLKTKLKSGFILPEVMGSDHCPIGIDITTNI